MFARKPHLSLGLLAIAGGLAYAIAGVVMIATGDTDHPVVNVLSVVCRAFS